MNHRHRILSLFCWVILPLLSFGQVPLSPRYLLEHFSHLKMEGRSFNHKDFFGTMAAEMGLSPNSDMVLEAEIMGENGYIHYKFQQYHAGLPIVGNTYILHERDGHVLKANGHFTPFADADVVPGISAAQAVQAAQQKMGASQYAPVGPAPILCLIDPLFPKSSGELLLAYQVDLASAVPFGKQRFYVDARQGRVISQFPLILEEGVPSTAVTKYYGIVDIITDSLGPQNYVLHDPTRGGGITVWNTNLSTFNNNKPHWDLTNDRQDEVALDAHYCTTRYFDMMKEKFDWIGQDGIGKALKVQVHNNGAGSVNAFWDGEYSNYGDGNCLYGPLTTLEVVGHEFTHGMIDYTSQLVYQSESGAINESLADMFGKALEWYADPSNFDWDLGHSFLLSPDAEPFRIMDDPKSVGMPAFYGGEYWFNFNDVHTNSSIGNLWFTMLVDGKTGVNEAGVNFEVPAIGMEKAIQLAFLTNKSYLTENSTYHNFYLYSLDAAEELYGPGAPEIAAVAEAWKAVGLPSSVTGPNFDLSISSSFNSFVQTCALNQYLPVTVKVQNLGQTAYLPSMNAVLILTNFNLPDKLVVLADTIQPGAMLTITVDDWLLADEPGFFSVEIELDVNDDDGANNYSGQYFNVYEYSDSDLSLYVNFVQPDCFSSTVQTNFEISNTSCEAIPAGANIGLVMENSNGVELWSEVLTLSEDLAPFGFMVRQYPVDAGSAGMQELLKFRLDYNSDPNLSNNEFETIIPTLEAITGDYLNPFNNESDLTANLYAGYLAFAPIVKYQGESFFGSTGFFNDPEYVTQCPDFEDNFNSDDFFGGVSSRLYACADLSAFDESTLSFDLVQFRNEFAELEGYPYSSMLQVKWSGTDNGKEIIFGQEEGDPFHHEISLPPYFKGKLEFKFYTELGQLDIYPPSSFELDDVLLFDNLQLQNKTVGTAQTETATGWRVMPNPAQERLHVHSELPLEKLELRGVDGQLMISQDLNGPVLDLDIAQVGNGMFFLRVRTEEGHWLTKKIVVIK